jgi:hypothetical protein
MDTERLARLLRIVEPRYKKVTYVTGGTDRYLISPEWTRDQWSG